MNDEFRSLKEGDKSMPRLVNHRLLFKVQNSSVKQDFDNEANLDEQDSQVDQFISSGICSPNEQFMAEPDNENSPDKKFDRASQEKSESTNRQRRRSISETELTQGLNIKLKNLRNQAAGKNPNGEKTTSQSISDEEALEMTYQRRLLRKMSQ